MKKRLCLFLALLMALMPIYAVATAEQEETKAPPVIGDLDDSGAANSTDAAILLRSLVGLKELTVAQRALADCDGDGKVTSSDAAAILRYVVGIDTLPPSGPQVTLPPTPTPPTKPDPKGVMGVTAIAKIARDNAPLRASTSVESEKVATLAKGTYVYVYGKSASWYSIVTFPAGKRGWIGEINLDFTTERSTGFCYTLGSTPVYEDDSVTSNRLTTYTKGTLLAVLSRDSNRMWYRVRRQDNWTEGYVLGAYLTTPATANGNPPTVGISLPTPATPEPTPTPTPSGTPYYAPAIPAGLEGVTAMARSKVGELPIRSGPDTSYSKITTVTPTNELFVLEKSGSWYRVQIKNKTTQGWCYAPNTELLNNRLVAIGELAADIDLCVYPHPHPVETAGTGLTKGTPMGIIGQDSSQSWYRVRILGTWVEGYVPVQYLPKIAVVDQNVTTPDSGPIDPNMIATGRISGTGVNLRTGAGTSFNSIMKMDKNTELIIYEGKKDSAGDEWFRVKLVVDSVEGWVHSDYVTLTSDRIVAFARINATDVHIRAGAGTSYSVVEGDPLALNTRVGIISKDQNPAKWYYVRICGTNNFGWVYATYVTLE